MKIVEMCSGFLYVVAVMGVTGARSDIQQSTVDLIKRVKNHTDLPLAVGFGISKPEHVENVIKSGSDGAIVASAIIDIITRIFMIWMLLKLKLENSASKLKESTKKYD